MTVFYEWDIEFVNEYGDIEHHEFMDRLSQCTHDEVNGRSRTLVLVRTQGSDATGVTDRAWAYVRLVDNNWVLPVFFDDGYHQVPQRFHAELAAWNRRA